MPKIRRVWDCCRCIIFKVLYKKQQQKKTEAKYNKATPEAT